MYVLTCISAFVFLLLISRFVVVIRPGLGWVCFLFPLSLLFRLVFWSRAIWPGRGVFLGLFFLRALELEFKAFGVFAFPLVLYLVSSGGWSVVMTTVSHTKVGDSLHLLGMPFGETDLCCEHVPHSRTEI
ncbi:hypothetical protein FOXG_18060 [Fusarium oxysporum f. sp. lycopersici 4287]|uniref:Transmembrane protein n=1 Tax=Fusarium oxysporum f. sp. lycopersici (strain 4287 / CBS 123668 / FGSC 9935 / NRRL 34936) TaxID=426428 RepID=A0A0J9WGZ7_FUSO4|nr:hypothetical protein FOXG_18060 [Fusarium oxysporum f. sp. lycopersici 4287]KAJ9428007.1 hypothetical protein QL093DRAFT_2127293 [Fusarium oxysporum]KNA95901.1 hypothetical protein FOXG_18060 [Fusarium oxysporum f. sp. lycopersici 4287]